MLKTIAVLFLMISPALADMAIPHSDDSQAQIKMPVQEAMGQQLIAEVNMNIQLRAQIVQLQGNIDDLKKQLEEAKKGR